MKIKHKIRVDWGNSRTSIGHTFEILNVTQSFVWSAMQRKDMF